MYLNILKKIFCKTLTYPGIFCQQLVRNIYHRLQPMLQKDTMKLEHVLLRRHFDVDLGRIDL